MFNNLIETTKGKEDVVVLMHDAGAKKSTAEHLEKFIEYLKAQGFVFKALWYWAFCFKQKAFLLLIWEVLNVKMQKT